MNATAVMEKIKIRVLLVEDEIIIQKIHRRMLEELNCYVDLAEDGEQAIAMANDSYNIIFMDIGLPKIDGIQAITQIRQRKIICEDIPIVVITGYTLDEKKQECLTAGASQVFIKPVSFEGFEKILKQYVGIMATA